MVLPRPAGSGSSLRPGPSVLDEEAGYRLPVTEPSTSDVEELREQARVFAAGLGLDGAFVIPDDVRRHAAAGRKVQAVKRCATKRRAGSAWSQRSAWSTCSRRANSGYVDRCRSCPRRDGELGRGGARPCAAQDDVWGDRRGVTLAVLVALVSALEGDWLVMIAPALAAVSGAISLRSLRSRGGCFPYRISLGDRSQIGRHDFAIPTSSATASLRRSVEDASDLMASMPLAPIARRRPPWLPVLISSLLLLQMWVHALALAPAPPLFHLRIWFATTRTPCLRTCSWGASGRKPETGQMDPGEREPEPALFTASE